MLTGEVYSRQAQDIIVPLTSNWRATISMMVEEGQQVQPGDLVVEFDGSEASRQLEQQREAMLAETAKTERELARLDKEPVPPNGVQGSGWIGIWRSGIFLADSVKGGVIYWMHEQRHS